jgi:hypothetical protein
MTKRDFPIKLLLPIIFTVFSLGIWEAEAEEGAKIDSDAVVGNEIRISVQAESEEEDPVGAWGKNRYLVVWQSTRNGPTEIYGTYLNSNGQIIHVNGHSDSFPVSVSRADQLFPNIAWGGKQFLVVWQDLRSKKNWEVYGGRIDSNGNRLDSNDLPIGIGSGNRRHPVVAWNGTNFLVVWMEERPGSGWEIVGRRIAPDGSAVDSKALLISGVEGNQTSPSVTGIGDDFFVVWMDGRKGKVQDIYGARIDRNGKVLDPAGIIIASAPGDQSYPSVAWNGENIITVWVDRREGTQYLLYGARIDPNGTVLDPTGIPLSIVPHLHMFPDISCRKSECLVVWEEEPESGKKITNIQDIVRDVNALLLKSSTKSLTIATPAVPIPISPHALGNHFSRVTTDGQKYLVVWKDYRSPLAGDFARLISIPTACKQ